MKIYTKTGDTGETGLFGGPRVPKDDPRIEAYGTIDELNAILGVARAERPRADFDEVLNRIQHDLFALGAELATPDPAAKGIDAIKAEHIAWQEEQIDQFEEQLEPLTQFILPGGTRAAALLHAARCVCRRAERHIVSLSRHASINPQLIAYVNRLSDLLFVLARAVNRAAGTRRTRRGKRHLNSPIGSVPQSAVRLGRLHSGPNRTKAVGRNPAKNPLGVLYGPLHWLVICGPYRSTPAQALPEFLRLVGGSRPSFARHDWPGGPI